jgi:hypothetical protein
MCQSAKTSLVAWLIAVVIAMIILTTGKKNAKWNAFFILTFITVQLLEFFIWHFRKVDGLSATADDARKAGCDSDKNESSSDGIVRLILIALWLQPLMQTYMAYKYGSGYKPQLMIIVMVYFVMFIWSITQALDTNTTFTATPVTCAENANGHLFWERSNSKSFIGPGPAGPLYLFGMLFGLLFMQPKLFGIIMIFIGAGTAFYSAKGHAKGEFASMWCLFAILYAIVAYMMAYSRRQQD